MFKKKNRDNNDKPEKNPLSHEIRQHVSEDEPSEMFRRWWADNGKSIIAGILLGVIAIVGWNFWQSHQQKQTLQSSAVFSALLEAYKAEDNAAVAEHAQTLKDDFNSTDYAAQGQMLYAITLLKQDNAAQAVEEMREALDKAKNPVTKNLARLNLAKAQVEADALDDAISTLSVEDKGGFTEQFNELHADILVLKGDNAAAADLYQQVLDAIEPGDPYRDIITTKLNQL